jgi:hypothetical protein
MTKWSGPHNSHPPNKTELETEANLVRMHVTREQHQITEASESYRQMRRKCNPVCKDEAAQAALIRRKTQSCTDAESAK